MTENLTFIISELAFNKVKLSYLSLWLSLCHWITSWEGKTLMLEPGEFQPWKSKMFLTSVGPPIAWAMFLIHKQFGWEYYSYIFIFILKQASLGTNNKQLFPRSFSKFSILDVLSMFSQSRWVVFFTRKNSFLYRLFQP